MPNEGSLWRCGGKVAGRNWAGNSTRQGERKVPGAMAVKIIDYLRPRTVREAASLLRKHERDAFVLGGGVSVVLSGSPRPMRAIDLSRLGLDRIDWKPNSIRLGAMVTLESLLESDAVAEVWNGVIPEACRTAATRPVRNLITIGGNIVQCYYWSTLPPLLLALEGKITIAGPQKTRTVTADEFFTIHPRRFLKRGEVVTRVDVPLPTPTPREKGGRKVRWGAAFLKFAKTYNDYAMINACAVVATEGDTVRKVRLTIGALDTLPQRFSEEEQGFAGIPFREEEARRVCEAAADRARVREDLRAGSEYRRHVAGVVLFRALRTAWNRATSREGKDS